MLWDSDGCAAMASTRPESGAGPAGSGAPAARGGADWLCLAATPSFAIMALVTGVLGGSGADMMCMGAAQAFPLGGMAPMYLLMSAFHAGPWLKLFAGRSRSSGA